VEPRSSAAAARTRREPARTPHVLRSPKTYRASFTKTFAESIAAMPYIGGRHDNLL
jgi:hypothetical protein